MPGLCGNANDIFSDAVAIPPAAGDLEAAHALPEPIPDFSVPDKRLGSVEKTCTPTFWSLWIHLSSYKVRGEDLH